MTAAAASRLHRLELTVEEVADASVNPKLHSFYYHFDQLNKFYNGDNGGEEMWKRIADLQRDFPGTKVAYQRPDGLNEMVVCILTPLMQRVHAYMPRSKEIMFVDTTSHVDLCNTSVTFLLTWTVAGAVPLGIILSYSQTEKAFNQGDIH